MNFCGRGQLACVYKNIHYLVYTLTARAAVYINGGMRWENAVKHAAAARWIHYQSSQSWVPVGVERRMMAFIFLSRYIKLLLLISFAAITGRLYLCCGRNSSINQTPARKCFSFGPVKAFICLFGF